MEQFPTIEIPKGKKIYFLSDFHLGIPNYEDSLLREKKLVKWLQSVQENAHSIYLMGDIFDFWYEYKTAIPKGYVRLFGKIAELTDKGVKVVLFRGNHDIWAFDYLNKECGVIIRRKPVVIRFNDKVFYLAHGDGLGKGDFGYKILKHLFENKLTQFLFRWIHPDLGLKTGLFFSRRSRLANEIKSKNKLEDLPVSKLSLYKYAKQYSEKNPEINYFIFGHNHLAIQQEIKTNTELIILGDWINLYSYAEFNGDSMALKFYH